MAEVVLDRLVYRYLDSFPSQSIEQIEMLTNEEVVEILADIRPVYGALALSRLNPLRAGDIFLMLPHETFKEVYRSLDPVKAAFLVARSKHPEKAKKIATLSSHEQKEIDELSRYPRNSAGTLMDISPLCLREYETVKSATKQVSQLKSKLKDVFVVDIDGKLVGYLPSQELLFAEADVTLDDIMRKSPPSINALAPKEDVIELFENFKITALPVTHIDGTVLGAIQSDNLVKAVHDHAIEAMAALGGASPEERALSPIFFSVRKRLPWLGINLLTAFVASAVVGVFEDTIAMVTALAVLLPVVAGQSGNTGSQAMAVTMRALALREIRTKHWPKVLFKELRAGFINGIAVAFITGVSVYFWSQNLALGGVITVAMILSMVIASVSGAAIPILLVSLGKDPAQSASVILTTVTDVIGFLSFLGLATLFSSWLVA